MAKMKSFALHTSTECATHIASITNATTMTSHLAHPLVNLHSVSANEVLLNASESFIAVSDARFAGMITGPVSVVTRYPLR
ncbi:hypothetical protein N0V92_009544 [Colletotrichum tropicale]|nr:hypothetical protein N0V92_009544 [Colletotrichum tropicale]